MGSGLVKCFVSNQIILEGIPVVIFPILQERGYETVEIKGLSGESKFVSTPNSTTVYANCFYAFQGLKFEAIGDDYARQTLIDSLENRISFLELLIYLHKSSYKTQQGKNQYHDHAFDTSKLFKGFIDLKSKDLKFDLTIANKLNWKKCQTLYETILTCADENRIFVKDYSGEARCLKFSICLKSAYDYAVEKTKGNTYHAQRFEAKLSDLIPKMKNKPLIKNLMKDKFIRNHLLESLFRAETGECYSIGYDNFISDNINKVGVLSEKKLRTIKKNMEFYDNFIGFQSFLNWNQLLIMPITGYTQDYDNRTGNEYFKLVKAVNKVVNEFVKYDEE
jgi:hypothetical protein